MSAQTEQYDAVIVGGGHNGLVAAAYLARAGLSTLVLERLDHVGGAAVSEKPFAGVDARLSRYSYLVSLLPQQIVDELGLDLQLRSRSTASYTPAQRAGRDTGLLVEHDEGAATRASFREITGGDAEYEAWREFYGSVAGLAKVVEPTLLRPLPRVGELEAASGPIWRELVERPLGESIESRFDDDTVRGVVLTDGLIGTFASSHDLSLRQNRCFLYHLIGNGTGEWRVPVGGMGAVTAALSQAAEKAGAVIRTGAEVTSVSSDGRSAEITYEDAGGGTGRVAARWVLSGVAPHVLARLQGATPPERPEGAQLKINLLVRHLPRLRSGIKPEVAFAGTFHVAEGYAELQKAYDDAAAGQLPTMTPGELYCHSLTDPSILGSDLAAQGFHTLTYFGVHMPARLFEGDDGSARDEAVRRAIEALDAHLEEPLEDCLARDADGRPCIEAKTPQDIEASLGMPGGHIFHGDLAWPWLSDSAHVSDDDSAAAWGVATGTPNVLLCGSGAVRGGAVSGIGGHNAAQAVLQSNG